MEHADAELARILAGPAADLHGHEGLVDGQLQFGHLGGTHLISLERNPAQLFVLGRQFELIDYGVVQLYRDLLVFVEDAAGVVDRQVKRRVTDS